MTHIHTYYTHRASREVEKLLVTETIEAHSIMFTMWNTNKAAAYNVLTGLNTHTHAQDRSHHS